jgi:hypothetical protein
MEEESSSGPTRVHTQANSETIILKELEYMNGLMVESIMETGSTIKCRAMEHSPGLMDVNMWASTLMI